MSDTYTINSGTITLTGMASWAENAVSASYTPNIGGINGMVYFTSSTIWNVPTGISNVRVIAIGAGGAANSPGMFNGSGGGYVEGVISVVGLTTIDIIVGTGGTYPNGTGGSSSFLSIGATGGQGGAGLPGVGFGGTFNISGSIGYLSTGYNQPVYVSMPGCVPWQYPSPMGEIAYVTAGTSGVKPNNNLNIKGAGSNGATTVSGADGCVTIYY